MEQCIKKLNCSIKDKLFLKIVLRVFDNQGQTGKKSIYKTVGEELSIKPNSIRNHVLRIMQNVDSETKHDLLGLQETQSIEFISRLHKTIKEEE